MRAPTSFRAVALLLALSAFAQRAKAQDPELPLARTLIQSLAPARDDADARCEALIRAALAAPRSAAAQSLFAATQSSIYDVAERAKLLALLESERDALRSAHGILQMEANGLRNVLRQCGGLPPENDGSEGFAKTVAVIGPFGDAGSRFLRVPFPPDAGFPAMDVELPGRFGPVRARLLERKDLGAGFRLLADGANSTGSHYVLWRVELTDATEGYLEVRYDGSILARVDGYEVGIHQSEDGNRLSANAHWFPVRLQKGEHEIVLQTGDASGPEMFVRLCDGNGLALPQAKEISASTPRGTPRASDPRSNAQFRTSWSVFLDAAEQASGDDRAALRIAAAFEARRLHRNDEALRLLLQLQQEPPTDPTSMLALAEMWARTPEFPDEMRNARERELQNEAIGQLPETHATALLARVKKLEDQDQREAALRLLRKEIDEKRAGSKIFEACDSLARALRFYSDMPALWEQWRAACPGDVTPRMQLAERMNDLGASDKALSILEESLAVNPSNTWVARRVVERSVALGRPEVGKRALERAVAATAQPSLVRELAEMRMLLAEAQDDAAAREAAIAEMEQAPRPIAAWHYRLMEKRIEQGDDQAALRSIEASLALDPDQPKLRRMRHALGGPAAEGDDFARFRRDGDAAIAAFKKGKNEEGASTSLLIDQRIVELLPDGSTLVEIHELRSVNDLQGVEALNNAEPAARADELLLVRTVGKDGKTYVPTRVEGNFSMPRLEPGAFVEWRYRDTTSSVGAEALRLDDFLFASQQEALYCSEWILITHKGSRGELRMRNLDCERETISLDGDRTATILRRTNVARLPQETATPPSESILPMAGYGEDADAWGELRDQRANFLSRTHVTPPLLDFATELLKDATTDAQRIQMAWDFCQKEIGDGEASNATEILLRKKGNRFLLATGLLRAVGVPMDACVAESARAELRGEGTPLFEDGPAARVPAARLLPRDGAPMWLFADTPRYWPLGRVPAHRGSARAFVLRESGYELVRLPAPEVAVQDLEIEGECAFEKSTTKLRATVHLHGQAGFSVAEQIRKAPADRQKLAARQIAQQFLQGWRMRNAACEGLEPPGQELKLEVDATGPAAQASGEGRALAALPIPKMAMRASFGDRDERQLPLQIDTDLLFLHRIRMTPGEGRRFGVLPKPAVFTFGPLDYQLTMTRDGDAAMLVRSVRLRPGVVEPALYADWIRLLAAIDQREEQRIEILDARSAEPAPK
jgi:tetratricopeptide (TPR) repeat protein